MFGQMVSIRIASFLLHSEELFCPVFICSLSNSGLLIFRGKKKQNFAGFSGVNSRKNRLISRDFRGKQVKIRGPIVPFRAIFAGEKSKFAEKSAHFAGF